MAERTVLSEGIFILADFIQVFQLEHHGTPMKRFLTTEAPFRIRWNQTHLHTSNDIRPLFFLYLYKRVIYV